MQPMIASRLTTDAQRVVFAVSSDAEPSRSLLRAAELARAFGAQLHVLRVLPQRERFGGLLPSPPPVDDAASLERFLEACRRTQLWCNQALSQPLPDDCWDVRLGDFLHEVRAYVAEVGATWLALAPQWHRFGRVVTNLARTAGLPVLVARARTSGGAIVAATDLADRRFPVLNQAAAIGRRLDRPPVAVHNLPPGAGEAPDDQSRAREGRLDRAARRIVGAESVIVHERDPVEGILSQARDRDAELIVVGTHPRSWLRRTFAPSVSSEVVNRTSRDVLVTPLRS